MSATSVRRMLASVVAWTVGAVAAVGVGLLALSMLGNSLTAKTAAKPLSPDAVAREASAAPSVEAPAQPAAEPTAAAPEPGDSMAAAQSTKPSTAAPAGHPTASGSAGIDGRTATSERMLQSPGGGAIAGCAPTGAYLVSWSPEQGYRVGDVRRGPSDLASVIFRGHDVRVVMTVRCLNGVPQAQVFQGGDD